MFSIGLEPSEDSYPCLGLRLSKVESVNLICMTEPKKSDSNWNCDSTGPAIIDVRKNLTSPIECGIKCTSLHNDAFV